MKKITVWGVCDDNGTSVIFSDKPVKMEGDWFSILDDSWIIGSLQNDLFSKTKPQEFVLMPIAK